MTEELYGDTPATPQPPPKPKPKRKTKKKPEIDGYLLKIQAMGSAIEIVSPIPRDRFVEEMVDTINEKGADPMWSGWYHLKKPDEKVVSIRLRSIDVVEEM